MTFKILIVVINLLSLCSCVANKEPYGISLDDAAIMLSENAISNGTLSTSKKDTLASGAGCLEALSFLIREDPYKYNELSENFHQIAKGYRFLNENSAVMEPGAREIYSMTLNMKKGLLCSKLKYEGFKLLKEKMGI